MGLPGEAEGWFKPRAVEAVDAWIDAIPDDAYAPCPCGCGSKWRFVEKDRDHLHEHEERFYQNWEAEHGKG